MEMGYLIKKIWKYCKRLEYIGIQPGISYLESKRIRMLNLIALTCIPIPLLFSWINWQEGRHLLSLVNLANTITSVTVLFLHHYYRYASARFVLIGFNFLFFSLGGLLFNNGAEYLLLSVLIVTILVYDKRWIQISSGIIITATMFFVAFYPTPLFSEQYVPVGRAVFNFWGAIVFIIVVIIYFKDVQYRYQDKIREQHAKLKEMNLTMENIFSIIAHDIRSPLVSVQDMLSLFQKDMITKQTAGENVSIINNRIALLNAALDNLLQWGSRNIHGLKTHQNNISVATIIQEVLHLLSPQANHKGIILKKDIDHDVNAYVDRDQIVMVLRNIISNAIKYSFFGESILVSAKEMNGQAIITIKDRGVGMTKDKLDQLFRNLQIPTLGTDGERGSGLGLLLCKELLWQNGGNFSITSRPNAGSTFTISLPIKSHKQKHELAQL